MEHPPARRDRRAVAALGEPLTGKKLAAYDFCDESVVESEQRLEWLRSLADATNTPHILAGTYDSYITA